MQLLNCQQIALTEMIAIRVVLYFRVKAVQLFGASQNCKIASIGCYSRTLIYIRQIIFDIQERQYYLF